MRKRHTAKTPPTAIVDTPSIDTSIDTIDPVIAAGTVTDGRDDTSDSIAPTIESPNPIVPPTIDIPDTPDTRFRALFPAVVTVPMWHTVLSESIADGFAAIVAEPTITARMLIPVVARSYDRHDIPAVKTAATVPDGDRDPFTGRDTNGRVTATGIRFGQNAIYVALATSGHVAGHVPNALIMALWTVEYPNARCPFVDRNYGWSTMTEFVNNRHGDVHGLPTAVDVVRAWRNTR